MRLLISAASLVTASALLVAPMVIGAQETRSATLFTTEHSLDLERISNPQISRDGRQIVYGRSWVNQLEDKWESAIWIVDADGSHNRFFAKGASAKWSPDGTRIAYLAEGEPKGSQLFVKWVGTDGAASQITRVSEAPADIEWSPDGKSIGFSMFVPKAPVWKIDMPKAPAGAKWVGDPRIVQQLHFKQDRRGFMDAGYRHMFVVTADGGTPRQLTSGDWNAGARFDGLDGSVGWSWTRDGRGIVVDGISDSTADLNYRNSNLYLVDVATGGARRLVTQDGVWTNPRVSPDGKLIAFDGYPATKASYQASEVYVMPVEGGAVRKISGTLDRDPGQLIWAADGSGVYFSSDEHGTSNIFFAAANGGVRQLTSGNHVLSLESISRNGVAAGVQSTYDRPNDVVRVDLQGKDSPVAYLTHANDDVLDRIQLGSVEKMTYTSTGGARIDGWIVKPPSFDPSKKYPMIMEIHGGPHGAYTVAFSPQFQNFAANGFVVFYTNPRGSTGYGSAFGNAIERAYPGVDYEDLMAGVDTVVARGYIDQTRMYVGGCSGGGVLSSWVIGHTNRFAAAAVRCPVIDWMSMAGQTDIPLFTYNFFDAPFWEKPEQWLKQSPLMYVGNVTTPTLLMTGELDRRTPMPQSEEYYAALKMRGVPASLLRFEGEYHGTGSKPSNWIRTQLYMMSWYKRYTRPVGSTRVSVVP
ncbi:MAG TPA: S9 family peptidase [Gemmatimonadaceae bacterium]|nr:S9 family peptidase [Gemmatimonadaceae bacterium]